MALEQYRAKRNFAATPEPRPTAPKSADGHSFVIQKHDARRLHYDFRLELDGVLKSWAVTKGPSLVAGEKRLAVEVEDHPLEYGGFEGTIPKGEYGGGAVLIWDRGTWTPTGDPHKGLAKGHLDFELSGEKLKGRWHLVRMRGKPGEKHENWLLIKGDDEFARAEGEPDILEQQPELAASGREIAEVAKESPGWSSKTGRIENVETKREKRASSATLPDLSALKGARKAAIPRFVEPMLASLVSVPPSGGRWLHEVKFDGYRIEARIEKGRVALLTRSGLDWTTKFGEAIVGAFASLPMSTALIDGELVVENEAGVSDFSGLQAALSEGRSERLVFYAFDCLYLNGYDLQNVALIERKSLLNAVVGSEFGPDPLQRPFRRGRPARSQKRLPTRSRRDRLEAAGLVLSSGPRQELEQDQVLGKAGVRDRRLCPLHGDAQRDRLACPRRLRGRRLPACRPGGDRVHRRDCGRSL